MRNPAACGLPLLLAACLSSAPPAPPVRWFDPVPAAPADGAVGPAVDLHVTAATHLGREIVVRTAPREVVFDGRHGWIDEPAALVGQALAPRFAAGRPAAAALRIGVLAFELDVQAEPRAVIRLHVQWADRQRAVVAARPAADRSPAALADAMAGALAEAANEVAAFVRGT